MTWQAQLLTHLRLLTEAVERVERATSSPYAVVQQSATEVHSMRSDATDSVLLISVRELHAKLDALRSDLMARGSL